MGGAMVGSGVKADHCESTGGDDKTKQVAEFGGHVEGR